MATQHTAYQMDEHLSEKVDKFKTAKQNSKQWGDIADVLRRDIVEEVPEGESLDLIETASGAKLGTLLEVQSKRFDMARFKKDHPDMDLDKYYVASVSRQLRVN